MRRLSPTAVTVIAVVLALLLVGYVLAGGSREETDKLTDEQVAERAETKLEDGCDSQQTYDLIKRELFRRAAQARGSDHTAFDNLSAYSAVRMESPTRSGQAEQAETISCTGFLSLDIPPGFQVVGGQRTLNADIGYSIAQAADGSGNVVTLSRADAIVASLSTLARIGNEASERAASPVTAEEGAGPDSQPTAKSQQPQVPRQTGRASSANAPETSRTPAQRPRATASPSFNCRRARTRSEIAVCNNAGLASLDRQMASQFNRAVSGATPEQRVRLQRTRTRFLATRESCRSVTCIAESYRVRMREIDALVAPPREPPQPAPPEPPQTVTPRNPPAQPVAAGPSFNCRLARTRGERAVCKDPGLARLDRQMAASFNSAMSRGTPAQRELLLHTRLRFLTYRDSCRSNSCVATSYRGRLKEISDIMAGRWKAY